MSALKEDIERIEQSGLFDSEWYLHKYPDVVALRMNPIEHFLWIGAFLGRDPSPTFSTEDYCSKHPDIRASSVNPLLHYIQASVSSEKAAKFLPGPGAAENFCADLYYETYPDVASAGLDAYEHFLDHGFLEGRTGTYFDADWYLDYHRDVAVAGVVPYMHYKDHGKRERRSARFVALCSYIENNKENYEKWIQNNAETKDEELLIPIIINSLSEKPKISIVMPVYNTPIEYLTQAIDSALSQSYTNLELCIADDASTDPEVRRILEKYKASDPRLKIVYRTENGHISEATNSALAISTGDYIALLDHDDLLAQHALFWIAITINKYPDAELIYSDSDNIDKNNNRYRHFFKSDFNYELFLAQNMISHLGVYRRTTVQDIDGFRKGFEGSQDYDLALRFIERIDSSKIIHIPRILYHWRAIEGSTALAPTEKSYALDAGVKALEQHLSRLGRAGKVTHAVGMPTNYRVRYELTDPAAIVSIVIPTKDRIDLLDMCISSIVNKSTYRSYEIIIVDNGSKEPETFNYFSKITDRKIKVVHDELPFNYSRVNNLGFKSATGKYFCLMNNDIEIITPDWMEEMMSFAQQPDVGCVGARLWYPDDTLQHAGIIIGIGGVANHAHKHFLKGDPGYFGRAALHQALSAVTGACLMIKASVYREVDGLDEELAIAYNDVDFCLRVRKVGYRNVWTPYAEMYHYESASRGSEKISENRDRFDRETNFMKQRWGNLLKVDPFYNPNLTINHEDFSIDPAPRVERITDIQSHLKISDL